jgi:glycosyltransferase involved in cell wall biosynthesis
MKKILFVDHSPIFGGASKSLNELIMHIASDLFHLSVLCNSIEIKNRYKENGIESYLCKFSLFQHTTAGWWKLNIKSIVQLIQWYFVHYKSLKYFNDVLNKINPNIVHLNSLTLLFYLKHIKKNKIKAIIHVRESVVNGYFGFRKYLMKRIIDKFADEAIYICEDNKFTLGTKKGSVVYNPVDTSRFKNQKTDIIKNKLGIKNTDKIILNVGGLRSINGPFVFLESLKYIKKHIPNFKALLPLTLYEPSNSIMSKVKRKLGNLLGYYSDRQKMDMLISKNELNNNVLRFNYLDNIEELFIISDVVAIPFTKPHFARAVLEAGAAGVPVVASDIGGISEVINHNVDGFLVKKGHAEGLAKSVIKCLSNQQEIIDMRNVAFKKVNKYFNVEAHVLNIIDIYKKIIYNDGI